MNLQTISNETLGILDRGHYAVAGRRVDVGPDVQTARAGTRSFSPEQLDVLRGTILSGRGRACGNVYVTRESTAASVRSNSRMRPPSGSVAITYVAIGNTAASTWRRNPAR